MRLVLCEIFSYDFPKIRNLPKIFLRSSENVAPSTQTHISVNVALVLLRLQQGVCWCTA